MGVDKINRERVYTLKCNICGHIMRDNILWKDCLIKGCKGEYNVIDEVPVGV